MLNLLADVLAIATRRAPSRRADYPESWNDRFVPERLHDHDRPARGWFSPGPDQRW